MLSDMWTQVEGIMYFAIRTPPYISRVISAILPMRGVEIWTSGMTGEIDDDLAISRDVAEISLIMSLRSYEKYITMYDSRFTISNGRISYTISNGIVANGIEEASGDSIPIDTGRPDFLLAMRVFYERFKGSIKRDAARRKSLRRLYGD